MSFDFDQVLFDEKRGFFKVVIKGKEYGWYGIHVEWKIFEGAHEKKVPIRITNPKKPKPQTKARGQ